jgi:hypothetical protein
MDALSISAQDETMPKPRVIEQIVADPEIAAYLASVEFLHR